MILLWELNGRQMAFVGIGSAGWDESWGRSLVSVEVEPGGVIEPPRPLESADFES